MLSFPLKAVIQRGRDLELDLVRVANSWYFVDGAAFGAFDELTSANCIAYFGFTGAAHEDFVDGSAGVVLAAASAYESFRGSRDCLNQRAEVATHMHGWQFRFFGFWLWGWLILVDFLEGLPVDGDYLGVEGRFFAE